MSKNHPSIIRIFSIITLAAFICTQAVPSYALRQVELEQSAVSGIVGDSFKGEASAIGSLTRQQFIDNYIFPLAPKNVIVREAQAFLNESDRYLYHGDNYVATNCGRKDKALERDKAEAKKHTEGVAVFLGDSGGDLPFLSAGVHLEQYTLCLPFYVGSNMPATAGVIETKGRKAADSEAILRLCLEANNKMTYRQFYEELNKRGLTKSSAVIPDNINPEDIFKLAAIYSDKDDTLVDAHERLKLGPVDVISGLILEGVRFVLVTSNEPVEFTPNFTDPVVARLKEVCAGDAAEFVEALKGLEIYYYNSLGHIYFEGQEQKIESPTKTLSETAQMMTFRIYAKIFIDVLKNPSVISSDPKFITDLEGIYRQLRPEDLQVMLSAETPGEICARFDELVRPYQSILGKGERRREVSDHDNIYMRVLGDSQVGIISATMELKETILLLQGKFPDYVEEEFRRILETIVSSASAGGTGANVSSSAINIRQHFPNYTPEMRRVLNDVFDEINARMGGIVLVAVDNNGSFARNLLMPYSDIDNMIVVHSLNQAQQLEAARLLEARLREHYVEVEDENIPQWISLSQITNAATSKGENSDNVLIPARRALGPYLTVWGSRPNLSIDLGSDSAESTSSFWQNREKLPTRDRLFKAWDSFSSDLKDTVYRIHMAACRRPFGPRVLIHDYAEVEIKRPELDRLVSDGYVKKSAINDAYEIVWAERYFKPIIKDVSVVRGEAHAAVAVGAANGLVETAAEAAGASAVGSELGAQKAGAAGTQAAANGNSAWRRFVPFGLIPVILAGVVIVPLSCKPKDQQAQVTVMPSDIHSREEYLRHLLNPGNEDCTLPVSPAEDWIGYRPVQNGTYEIIPPGRGKGPKQLTSTVFPAFRLYDADGRLLGFLVGLPMAVSSHGDAVFDVHGKRLNTIVGQHIISSGIDPNGILLFNEPGGESDPAKFVSLAIKPEVPFLDERSQSPTEGFLASTIDGGRTPICRFEMCYVVIPPGNPNEIKQVLDVSPSFDSAVNTAPLADFFKSSAETQPQEETSGPAFYKPDECYLISYAGHTDTVIRDGRLTAVGNTATRGYRLIDPFTNEVVGIWIPSIKTFNNLYRLDGTPAGHLDIINTSEEAAAQPGNGTKETTCLVFDNGSVGRRFYALNKLLSAEGEAGILNAADGTPLVILEPASLVYGRHLANGGRQIKAYVSNDASDILNIGSAGNESAQLQERLNSIVPDDSNANNLFARVLLTARLTEIGNEHPVSRKDSDVANARPANYHKSNNEDVKYSSDRLFSETLRRMGYKWGINEKQDYELWARWRLRTGALFDNHMLDMMFFQRLVSMRLKSDPVQSLLRVLANNIRRDPFFLDTVKGTPLLVLKYIPSYLGNPVTIDPAGHYYFDESGVVREFKFGFDFFDTHSYEYYHFSWTPQDLYVIAATCDPGVHESMQEICHQLLLEIPDNDFRKFAEQVDTEGGMHVGFYLSLLTYDREKFLSNWPRAAEVIARSLTHIADPLLSSAEATREIFIFSDAAMQLLSSDDANKKKAMAEALLAQAEKTEPGEQRMVMGFVVAELQPLLIPICAERVNKFLDSVGVPQEVMDDLFADRELLRVTSETEKSDDDYSRRKRAFERFGRYYRAQSGEVQLSSMANTGPAAHSPLTSLQVAAVKKAADIFNGAAISQSPRQVNILRSRERRRKEPHSEMVVSRGCLAMPGPEGGLTIESAAIIVRNNTRSSSVVGSYHVRLDVSEGQIGTVSVIPDPGFQLSEGQKPDIFIANALKAAVVQSYRSTFYPVAASEARAGGTQTQASADGVANGLVGTAAEKNRQICNEALKSPGFLVNIVVNRQRGHLGASHDGLTVVRIDYDGVMVSGQEFGHDTYFLFDEITVSRAGVAGAVVSKTITAQAAGVKVLVLSVSDDVNAIDPQITENIRSEAGPEGVEIIAQKAPAGVLDLGGTGLLSFRENLEKIKPDRVIVYLPNDDTGFAKILSDYLNSSMRIKSVNLSEVDRESWEATIHSL